MRIIISPAKKMRVDTDSLPWHDLPAFLPKTEQLACALQSMRREELKMLWKCSDQITDQNVDRLHDLDLYHRLTPAILAYDGIQYQHMAPGVFSEQEYAYIQEHLRILSGFYGILKPFDGVTPYRLEMQAKLRIKESRDLYSYWGNDLAATLVSETNSILNLASKEYSMCISKFLTVNTRFITCIFGQETAGKVVEKGTLCKMARGEMVRFLAENQITNPDDATAFDRLMFRFDPSRSNDNTFVFLLNPA